MSLISPNFVLSRSLFSILARGLFPKLLEKALTFEMLTYLPNRQTNGLRGTVFYRARFLVEQGLHRLEKYLN